MTIFYFTATGNSLAAAKRIGAGRDVTLLSVPRLMQERRLRFKDDALGLVFPVYSFGVPNMVRKFLEAANWEADYAFAVATYGMMCGTVLRRLRQDAARTGKRFHYMAAVRTLDNFLPLYEVEAQRKQQPEKDEPGQLAKIAEDIGSRQYGVPGEGIGAAVLSAFVGLTGKSMLKGGYAKSRITQGGGCSHCGTCAKVCPAGNITGGVFGKACEACLACVHNCPQGALHVKGEKSAARYRHPDVALSEIIAANSRR